MLQRLQNELIMSDIQAPYQPRKRTKPRACVARQSLCHVRGVLSATSEDGPAIPCILELRLRHGCTEQRCASSQPRNTAAKQGHSLVGARARGPRLLVAAQDVAYERRARERLVDLHRGAARVREQLPHALALQRLHEDVGAFPRLAAVPVDPLFPPCRAPAASGLVHPTLGPHCCSKLSAAM